MKTKITASDFINNEMLKTENQLFWGRILGSSIGYLIITLWLNSILANASIWFVWTLIIIQLLLYFLIFFVSYQRSKVFGLNKNFAFGLFIVLAILGRVNDWELLIIPLLVIAMLVFSARNKKVSEKGQSMLVEK